jgi:hypothetical protein
MLACTFLQPFDSFLLCLPFVILTTMRYTGKQGLLHLVFSTTASGLVVHGLSPFVEENVATMHFDLRLYAATS